jgi:hypothetical protein
MQKPDAETWNRMSGHQQWAWIVQDVIQNKRRARPLAPPRAVLPKRFARCCRLACKSTSMASYGIIPFWVLVGGGLP